MNFSNFYHLTRNAAKCLACGDVVESKYRHDFVTCSCGSLSVDGGLAYSRRSYADASLIQNLDETRQFSLEELVARAADYRDSKGIWAGTGFGEAQLADAVECAKEWYDKDI